MAVAWSWSETDLHGVLLFSGTAFTDDRGFFTRTFDAATIAAAGIDPTGFVQDSLSRSRRGVIRGLHLRAGGGESKLVRCSWGAVFDVVVDLRKHSPTYRHWQSFDLTGENQASVYIPAGCAHGHQTLTEVADISYRIDRVHDASEDVNIAYDDPELAITWPLAASIVSDRDRCSPPLADLGL